MKRPPPSLKGQALALLARREHSRAELRTKLLSHARKRAQAAAEEAARSAALGPRDPWDRPRPDEPEAAPAVTDFDAEASAEEVERVLDELEAARHLSDARFAESRVNARAKRQGTSRIRQELARHGVELDEETARQLRETELERARAVWRRKYGGTPPSDPAERARQMRFLAARGFAAEVVRRVVGGRDPTD